MSGPAISAGRPQPLALLTAGFLTAPGDVLVTDVTLDSREVRPGGLFLACRGRARHGVEFAHQALERGARAVVYEEPAADDEAARRAAQAVDARGGEVFVAALPELRSRLGLIADRFFEQPSRRLWIAGVTGTNGKSTCAWLIAQVLSLCGRPAAYIGTLGVGVPGALAATAHTTADVLSVHRQLAGLAQQGARCVGMEVSSHALDQGRVDAVRFAVAAFTNLTQDHLDYHGSMQAYGHAKARLFEGDLAARIINVDDAFGRELAAAPGAGELVLTSRAGTPAAVQRGTGGHARARHGYVYAAGVRHEAAGLSIDVRSSWGDARVAAPLIGDFNVDNVLTVLGVVLSAGVPLGEAAQALACCSAPAGRMEVLRGAGRTAIVDYAHTPDALAKALQAVRAHCAGRLLLVFGCGGERDAGKRPLMGRIAAELADEVIVTDDNPRREDPAAIVAGILAGMPAAAGAGVAGAGHGAPAAAGKGAAGVRAAGAVPVRVEHDRAAAIRAALERAGAHDVVLIAGKGHEDYQLVGALRRPFSDQAVVRAFLQERA